MISRTKPKDFNKKFEVVTCFIQHENTFLLLHRQGHKPQGNTWGVPGGKVHKDDADNATALAREIQEEIGVSVEPAKLNYFKSFFVQYPEYDFVYHMHFHKVKALPKIDLHKEEHKDYRWVTPQEALGMVLIPDEDFCIKEFFDV